MSRQGKFWKDVQKVSKSVNASPVQIGQVMFLSPLRISFNGLELSQENGDAIYINHLLLDENINLDLASMDNPQNIDPALWQGDNQPTSTVSISGTQKTFLTDFYNFFKNWQKRYIIEVGDYVAIQKLGNNTYIVLQKVQKLDEQ